MVSFIVMAFCVVALELECCSDASVIISYGDVLGNATIFAVFLSAPLTKDVIQHELVVAT